MADQFSAYTSQLTEYVDFSKASFWRTTSPAALLGLPRGQALAPPVTLADLNRDMSSVRLYDSLQSDVLEVSVDPRSSRRTALIDPFSIAARSGMDMPQ